MRPTETRWFAACNAALYAPDEALFRRWAEIANHETPPQEAPPYRSSLSALDQGNSYYAHVEHGVQEFWSEGKFGKCAALLEILIASDEFEHDVYAQTMIHKQRAQALRNIDRELEASYHVIAEFLPNDQRMALDDALLELEEVLKLDPYDAESWNFQSAWSLLLNDYEGALQAANKSIELRPEGYPKPWTNKAAAFFFLGRLDEGRLAAQTALEQAIAVNATDDIELARNLLNDIPEGDVPSPTWTDLEPMIERIMRAASMTADNFFRQAEIDGSQLSQQLVGRCRTLRGRRSREYVSVMADVLFYFPPEVAWFGVIDAANQDRQMSQKCLSASLYLATHTSEIQQKDALRFIALIVLGHLRGPDIVNYYRSEILAPSEVELSPLAGLERLLQAEFEEISPALAGLIREEPPASLEEKRIAQARLRSEFE